MRRQTLRRLVLKRATRTSGSIMLIQQIAPVDKTEFASVFVALELSSIELARRNRHVAEVDGWPASGRGRRPRRLAGAVEPPRRRRGKSKRPSGQGGCRPPEPNASKSYAAAARFAFARPSIIRPIPRELLELRVEATIHQRDPTALRRGANCPINFRLQCKRVSAWPDIRARKL